MYENKSVTSSKTMEILAGKRISYTSTSLYLSCVPPATTLEAMNASLILYQNLNVFSSSYSIVSLYLHSMNSLRSSPVANHCGVAGMPTISSMYTGLIKVSQCYLLSTRYLGIDHSF